MSSISRKQQKTGFLIQLGWTQKGHRLYKTLKCKAIHFPKLAHSGFNNMGWALQLYLPRCIFKAAILNQYIFSLPWNETSRQSCGKLTQSKDRQSSLNKVCRWPPGNMFLLNKSHNNQLLGFGMCVCPGLRGRSQNPVVESNWKIIAWLQWPYQPAVLWQAFK